MDNKLIEIPIELQDTRADIAISKLTNLSRSKIVKMLENELITNKYGIISKSDLLQAGDLLNVKASQTEDILEIKPKKIPDLKIIFEDEHIVIVDKPAGIAAHPSLGWAGENVLNGLASFGILPTTQGPPERQGIVSRLDVGTSGLMVIAKSEIAFTNLKKMFKERQVEKTYHALVQGFPDPIQGTINAPIVIEKNKSWKFKVGFGGKPSITHYRLLEAFRYGSLLEINLETGRTHQIRVHFSALKHPCFGDIIYGADKKLATKLKLDRQWLHATRLVFFHPVNGEKLNFMSEYSKDLNNALEILQTLS